MGDLMQFLSFYAMHVHSNRYYRSALLNNLGATFLDIIMASDIAYTIALIKNSSHVWQQQVDIANMEEAADDKKVDKSKIKKVKPLYTLGEGKKRTFGNSTWNDEGKEFFSVVLNNWKSAFDKNDPQYKILCRHWNRIE